MTSLIRTESTDPDFQKLVKQLDKELAVRDGDDHAFYAQYNKLDLIKQVIVAFRNGKACGCGALKEYAEDTMEVKRMFVPLEYRRQGIGSLVLTELENWAMELGYDKCILETGEKQPEAVNLYKRCDYRIIPNYGQYAGMDASLCFEKNL